MASVYSVSQVTAYIKNMFTQDFALNRISIRGEVSNCKYHTSGHIYFTLKDGGAQIAAVMFAGQRKGLSFTLAEGQQVTATGSVDVYERDGRYQLYVRKIERDGTGDLYARFERLKAELLEMIPSQAGNKTRLIFHAPSRGLIGYHSEFLTDTRGTGVMNRIFYAYEPYKGEIESHRNGVLISSENGTAVAYSLWKLQDRGPMFIEHNSPVYIGMIIGEHTKSNDLDVNPTKSKQLTNIRAAGKDEAIDLVPPRKLSLEQALSYIQQDELLEVTPKSLRLRKKILDPLARKRAKMGATA